MTTATNPSRRGPHPTALALFRSLDERTSIGSSARTSEGVAHDRVEIGKTRDATSGRAGGGNVRRIANTLGWRGRHSQSPLYPISLNDGVRFHVSQIQRGEVDGDLGTGATVWPASLVLLKYLERNAHLLDGKTVADLGSGTGITSIAAAVLGASLVACTDGCGPVVDLAEGNVRMARDEIEGGRSESCGRQETPIEPSSSSSSPQSLPITIGGCEVHVLEYKWGNDDGTMMSLPRRGNAGFFDVILVSDCVLPKLYPIAPLVDAIDELAGPHTVAVLSYEHRYFPDYDPRDKFRELAERKGLGVRVVPPEEQDPIFSVDDIEIWEVRRGQMNTV